MFNRNFSTKTVKALAAKGIAIVGSQAVAAFEGDVYFSGVAYMLDDNGTGRLRTFTEVLALAN